MLIQFENEIRIRTLIMRKKIYKNINIFVLIGHMYPPPSSTQSFLLMFIKKHNFFLFIFEKESVEQVVLLLSFFLDYFVQVFCSIFLFIIVYNIHNDVQQQHSISCLCLNIYCHVNLFNQIIITKTNSFADLLLLKILSRQTGNLFHHKPWSNDCTL